VLAVRAPLDWEPLIALLPVQPPEAVQAVALLDTQLKVVLPPLVMVLGLALMLTVALGVLLTVTVADCAALPPLPVQLSVYVALAVSAPVDWVPVTAFAPDQPPEAVQEVAFVAVQFNVALLPLLMALGPTLKVTVGAAALMETVADWVAVPPGPEQARV
jgi:hypothetical protein